MYGEKIAGGTSKLYLTAGVLRGPGPDHRGFRTDLGDTSPRACYGREWMSKVPYVAVAVGGLAVGLHYLNQRRARSSGRKSGRRIEPWRTRSKNGIPAKAS